MGFLGQISRLTWKAGKGSRDLKALLALASGNPEPYFRRKMNKWLGRKVGRRIYRRKRLW